MIIRATLPSPAPALQTRSQSPEAVISDGQAASEWRFAPKLSAPCLIGPCSSSFAAGGAWSVGFGRLARSAP